MRIKNLIPKVENIETQKNLKEINETINKILEEVDELDIYSKEKGE